MNNNSLVMDNRFFVLSLVVIGLVSLLGVVVFPWLGIGLLFWRYIYYG